MVITVEQCCCGCSLKTGTIIIGIVCALGSLSGVVLNVMGATNSLMTPEAAQKANVTEEARENHNKVITGSKYIHIMEAIVSCLRLILSIVLIYGAFIEMPSLIWPWIIYAIMSVIGDSIMYVVMIVLYFMYDDSTSGIALLVFTPINIALSVYCIIVVNSLYVELKGQ